MSLENETAMAYGGGGHVLLPGADGYETARTVWDAMVDRRPAVVARPTSATEVAQAVRFGRERSLEIGVKGGGHSMTGLAVPEGGLLIDLSLLGSVRVDPEPRRAWVGGGARLAELKAHYDPENVFHLNHNIAPAKAE